MKQLTKPFTCLTWDLDGTLINSWSFHVESVKRVVHHLEGITLTSTKILANNKASIIETFQYFLTNKANWNLAIHLYEDHYINLITRHHSSILFNGIKETLIALKECNIKQCLYTANTRKITETIVNHCTIKEFFELIITNEDFPSKPSPDGMTHIISSMGNDSKSHGLIGDSCTDIKIALQTDVTPFWGAWGKKSNIKNFADYTVFVLQNPRDILTFVRKGE